MLSENNKEKRNQESHGIAREEEKREEKCAY